MSIISQYINGRSVSSKSNRLQPIYNPATGHSSNQVQLGDQLDVDAAVEAAKQAFISWSETSPLKRARVLFNFRELL